MDIVHPAIERYLENLVPVSDPVLQEMEQWGKTHRFPIVGPLVGHFLYQITVLLKATHVLELGSGYGYSAYWFARGLGPEGKVICTEGSAANIERARTFFQRGGLLDKVEFLEGDALDIIEKLDEPFDIIFNDVDKEQYPQAFPKIIARLKPGGVFFTDNMLWSGAVLESSPLRESTRGILEYTRLLYTTPGLLTTLLPLRDGVSMTIKLS